MSIEIRYIDINGAKLGYEVHAEGTDRPPLIMMHGYTGRTTGGLYKELIEDLAKEFTVYALDARGHGASADEFAEFSLAASASDVAEFAKKLGIVGALFVGHSFGALTGLLCGLRHPGALGAICLLTIGDAAPNEYKKAQAVGGLYNDLRHDAKALTEALEPMYIHRPEMAARHAASLMLMDPSMHDKWFSEYPYLSLLDELPNLKVPVLFFNGGKDNVVPLYAIRAMSEKIPLCKEVTFMTHGHTVPLEAPDVVAREIINFYQHDISQFSVFGDVEVPDAYPDRHAEAASVSAS